MVVMGLIMLFIPVSAAAVGCQGGSVSVCGVSIPFPDKTPLDTSVIVHIPADVLGDSYSANSNLNFTVECLDDRNGGASYQAVNVEKISCNAFPCQTSTVRLCDTSVSVPGGAPLGGMVHLTMPPPFSKTAFSVECIGSGDNPPVYQITDRAGVSCNLQSP